MLKCDLHLHTKEDENWIQHTAKELIDSAAELNFEVLSFTFHDKLFYSEELVEYAKSKNILLIPGVELTLEGKHVLVYGLKDIENIKTLQDLKDKDCLIVAPHPYFKDGSCLGEKLVENIDLFDGIEYSHFYNHLFNWNKEAVKVANENNIPLVGNSDCHNILLQFNKTYSMIDSEKNMESIFEAIRNKSVVVVSQPLPLKDIFKIIFNFGRFLERFK